MTDYDREIQKRRKQIGRLKSEIRNLEIEQGVDAASRRIKRAKRKTFDRVIERMLSGDWVANVNGRCWWIIDCCPVESVTADEMEAVEHLRLSGALEAGTRMMRPGDEQ